MSITPCNYLTETKQWHERLQNKQETMMHVEPRSIFKTLANTTAALTAPK